MSTAPRVVVSGLGQVSAAGLGREAMAAALVAAQPEPVEVDLSASYHLEGGARRALLARSESEIARWVPPMEARRFSRPSKLAVAAARMALDDAGLAADALAGPTAIVVATTFGPSEFTERILGQILADGPQGASPFLFTQSVANAPAAQMAMVLGARGPNVTVTQREAGPLIALGRAVAEVAAAEVAAGEVPEAELATLPGFVITVFHEGIGQGARHLAVRDNGDVYVARRDGVLFALRDADGDGMADRIEQRELPISTGLEYHAPFLYFSDDASVRK